MNKRMVITIDVLVDVTKFNGLGEIREEIKDSIESAIESGEGYMKIEKLRIASDLS